MIEQLMKCRRCRKVTSRAMLADAPRKRGLMYTEKCCPNCGCKTFTMVDKSKDKGKSDEG